MSFCKLDEHSFTGHYYSCLIINNQCNLNIMLHCLSLVFTFLRKSKQLGMSEFGEDSKQMFTLICQW